MGVWTTQGWVEPVYLDIMCTSVQCPSVFQGPNIGVLYVHIAIDALYSVCSVQCVFCTVCVLYSVCL